MLPRLDLGESGHRARPGDVHGAHRVAARRVARVRRQDRDAVEPELQDDVPGAVRRRIGRCTAPPIICCTRYVPPGATRGETAGQLRHDRVAGHATTTHPVVLSSDCDVASNYPVARQASPRSRLRRTGTLPMIVSQPTYTAPRTLLSMRQFTDAFAGTPSRFRRGRSPASATSDGAGAPTSRCRAIIERQTVPAFRYAAFATYNGARRCTFGGGATPTATTRRTTSATTPPSTIPSTGATSARTAA